MMQIVIDMPKKIFNEIQKSNFITVGETYAKKLINYIKKGTPLEQEPCNDMVSRGVFEQVMWERDIAIEQLKELGYELGEKPKTGWIPVSEYGYPTPENEYKHFLTVDNKGEITIQEFLLSLDEEPQPYFTGMRNIVAYMSLPEPYKG